MSTFARAHTIPARLAQKTRVSSSPAEAKQRVIQLYREWYRAAPELCTIYTLPIPVSQLRHSIRANFERNRYVTDSKAIEVLLLKSRQDYQEAMNQWKTPDHVMGILTNVDRERANEALSRRTFLQKFYDGRDGNAVLPGPEGVV
jgi:NADH dehydrogenase (ubiquinone) 1 alpha subcomplex subunit 6